MEIAYDKRLAIFWLSLITRNIQLGFRSAPNGQFLVPNCIKRDKFKHQTKFRFRRIETRTWNMDFSDFKFQIQRQKQYFLIIQSFSFLFPFPFTRIKTLSIVLSLTCSQHDYDLIDFLLILMRDLLDRMIK